MNLDDFGNAVWEKTMRDPAVRTNVIVECPVHGASMEITKLSFNRTLFVILLDAIRCPIISWRLVRFVWEHHYNWCEHVVKWEEEE